MSLPEIADTLLVEENPSNFNHSTMLYNTSPDALFVPQSTIDPSGFGKIAIITGCSSGIGLASTQLLLAHQYSVCGLDKDLFNYELLREEDHGRFHFHQGDLTLPSACQEGVNICLHSFGSLERMFFFSANAAGC